jgi:hypothetical protein
MVMSTPKRNGFALFIASTFLLIGLSLLLVVPVEALYELSGRMKLGLIYLGLEAFLGEPLARITIASPVLVLAYVFFRKAYPIRLRKH